MACGETVDGDADSTKCNLCHKENKSEHRQTYLEMEVPPDGSCLGQHVEEYFN